jgi:hypothetical protein
MFPSNVFVSIDAEDRPLKHIKNPLKSFLGKICYEHFKNHILALKSEKFVMKSAAATFGTRVAGASTVNALLQRCSALVFTHVHMRNSMSNKRSANLYAKVNISEIIRLGVAAIN